jgi:hypothetical protein
VRKESIQIRFSRLHCDGNNIFVCMIQDVDEVFADGLWAETCWTYDHLFIKGLISLHAMLNLV